MRVVVDTNVWVSGLILPDSPPGKVLQAVREGELEALASWPLVEELVDVLSRPHLRHYEIRAGDIQELVVLLAPLLPSVEVNITLRDPGDAPVVAAAVAGDVQAIITGDADLLQDRELRSWLGERGIQVLRPSQALSRLRET